MGYSELLLWTIMFNFMGMLCSGLMLVFLHQICPSPELLILTMTFNSIEMLCLGLMLIFRYPTF